MRVQAINAGTEYRDQFGVLQKYAGPFVGHAVVDDTGRVWSIRRDPTEATLVLRGISTASRDGTLQAWAPDLQQLLRRVRNPQ